MSTSTEYMIYTDGSHRRKKTHDPVHRGFGAWACIIMEGDTEVHRLAQPVFNTTISRMELQAILEGLRLVEDGIRVVVHTDSQYAAFSMTRWMNNWIRNNWMRPPTDGAPGAPVANQDILRELAEHKQRLGKNLKVVWVPRNSNKYNEECDRLAQELTKKMQDGELTP